MLNWVFLTPLRRFSEVGLLAIRLFVGVFLLWTVWDKISRNGGVSDLATFLSRNNFPSPVVFAQLSTWTQFSVGLAFIMGLFTRWAGVLCAINFAVAALLVARSGGALAAFAPAVLMLLGLDLALRGAGRFGLDATFEAAPPGSDLRLG